MVALSNVPIITEDNFRVHLDDGKLQRCGTLPRDFSRVPVGSMSFAPEFDMPLIDPSEYLDRARQKEKDGRLSDFILDAGIPCLHQQQTNFCHGNSPCGAIMYLESTQGKPFELLSAASIAAPVTNFTNNGAYIEDDLRQCVEVGCASVKYVPVNQVTADGFKRGWKEDAAKHRVSEWWDLGQGNGQQMYHRVMTAVLSGFPVCVAYNWWRHAVTIVDVVILKNGQLSFRIRNSWGEEWGEQGFGVIDRAKCVPNAAYVPRQIVMPA